MIKNQKVSPRFYYGLHFGDGVAEYRQADGSIHRKYISNDTAKKMNATFAGKPLKINHPGEDIDFKNLKSDDVDGWVINSFYNKKDGKHWAKILVLTEDAENKIKQGWTLSNGYHIIGEGGAGGEYQGVPYDMEVTNAEYEHLALVENPRYEYSKILTEEDFEAYNSEKEAELGNRFVNSKDQTGEKEKMFKFFKKETVKNSDDLKGLSVELPKSKTEMTIDAVINMADEEMIKRSQNPDIFCTGNEKVKLENGEVSTVAEMLKKLAEVEKVLASMQSEKEGADNAEEIDDVVEEDLDEDEYVDTDNTSDKEDDSEEKTKNSKESEDNFTKIINAEKKATKVVNEIVISSQGLSLGTQRYGSGK